VRAGSDVRFDLKTGVFNNGEPVVGIAVYEIQNDQIGSTVCESRLPDPQWKSPPKIGSWIYGEDLGGTHQRHECNVLAPGHVYRIAVHLSDRRVLGTDFEVRDDGSVINVK
jgi:hypothetical protein